MRPKCIFVSIYFHEFYVNVNIFEQWLSLNKDWCFELRTKLEPFSISHSEFIGRWFNTRGGWRGSWFRGTLAVHIGRWGLSPREILAVLPGRRCASPREVLALLPRGRCASPRDQRPDPHGCHGLHGGEHEHGGRYRRYTPPREANKHLTPNLTLYFP